MRIAVLVVVLAACTHHRPLHQARELANGDEVVAQNHVGQTQPARVVHGANGELQLHSPIGVLPSHEVAQITETSHGAGAIQGLGLGVLIGGTLGAVVGYSSGDDECEGDCFLTFTAGDKAKIGGVVLGGLGGLVGLVIGAATGSTTIYEEGDTRITPIAPQGSTAGFTVTF